MLIKKARLWVGSHLMLLATKLSLRIIGEQEVHKSFRLDLEDDEEGDESEGLVYPSVQLNDRAREMIYKREPRPQTQQSEPPLRGSLADRVARDREARLRR